MDHIGAGDQEHTSDQSNAVPGMAVRLALGEEGGPSRREAGRTPAGRRGARLAGPRQRLSRCAVSGSGAACARSPGTC